MELPVGWGRDCCLPPRVAESKKWVPYFLMRFSVTCCRLGLLPRRRMLRTNSGARGRGKLKKSFLSRAKLFTFHRANSLQGKPPYFRTRSMKPEIDKVIPPLEASLLNILLVGWRFAAWTLISTRASPTQAFHPTVVAKCLPKAVATPHREAEAAHAGHREAICRGLIRSQLLHSPPSKRSPILLQSLTAVNWAAGLERTVFYRLGPRSLHTHPWRELHSPACLCGSYRLIPHQKLKLRRFKLSIQYYIWNEQ